jgi:hypothetical protein
MQVNAATTNNDLFRILIYGQYVGIRAKGLHVRHRRRKPNDRHAAEAVSLILWKKGSERSKRMDKNQNRVRVQRIHRKCPCPWL